MAGSEYAQKENNPHIDKQPRPRHFNDGGGVVLGKEFSK